MNCRDVKSGSFCRVRSVLHGENLKDESKEEEADSFSRYVEEQNGKGKVEESEEARESDTSDSSTAFCYFCHGTENLARCTGPCGRSYHLMCIGMKASPRMNSWKCRACRGNELKSSDHFKKHCLRNWYFKSIHPVESDAKGKSKKSIILEGNTAFNGEVWKCSPLVKLIDSTHVITTTGSIYVLLVGELNDDDDNDNNDDIG